MDRSQIESYAQELEVNEETKQKLIAAGLVIPKKPTQQVDGVSIFDEWDRMKRQYGGVANIPNSELGEYLDKWTSLIAYARWTEAVADMKQQSAREIRDTVQKQLYTLQDGSREIRAAMVSIEPIYLKWEKEFTERQALYIAVKGLREGYEQRAFSISREVSRRTQDIDSHRRAHNANR